jgi:hypothetical protein
VDAKLFDRLARSLTESRTRRRLLALVASVPHWGGLVALLDADVAEGKGRRKRRKKRHKHGKGRRRNHGNPRKKSRACTPESGAQTCAGKCGSVTNNCQQPVDCGSCACDPPCDTCFVCQDQGLDAPGMCVADPNQQGEACGEPGQVCQATGACACTATSCTAPQTCGGSGVAGECGCTPNSCAQTNATCGVVSDGCGGQIDCGTCATGSTRPLCVNNVCTGCSSGNPCPAGGCCTRNGACIENGAACNDGSACTTGDTCQNGTCTGTSVACNSPGECQRIPGTCDATSGQCTYPTAADGTRCGNKCTQACSNGACGAGTAVTCPPAANACQVAGTCNPATGTCSPPTNKAAGTSCASTMPCGECDGEGACVGCTGTDCCGTDDQCHGNLQPCNPGGDEICCGGQCTCTSGGICQVSPNGAVCCCTEINQVCTDSGSVGTCEFCGFEDQPCCAGECFDDELICIDDTCTLCGFLGESCCAGDDCRNGTICVNGSCERCGVLGQPCCPGDVCIVGTCFAENCIG